MERTWSCLDCRFENAEPICFTAGGTFDPQRLARAFLKIKTTSVTRDEVGDDSSHAFDCIDEMVQEAPGMAVVFLLAALDVCETVEQVAVLGAGSAREPAQGARPRRHWGLGARGAQARQGSLPPLLDVGPEPISTPAYGIAW